MFTKSRELANSYVASNQYVADRYDPRLMACMSMLSDVQEIMQPAQGGEANDLLNGVKMLLSDMADEQRGTYHCTNTRGVKA